jgi:hypothetical protein
MRKPRTLHESGNRLREKMHLASVALIRAQMEEREAKLKQHRRDVARMRRTEDGK